MDLLPTSIGTRPRLACELRPEGLVLARAETTGLLSAVVRAPFSPGDLTPGLRAGNVPGRAAIVAALRRAADSIALRGPSARGQNRYLTLVLPDTCVRVLLLDFDELPSRAAEALPIVRFRLKKLLPFDVEHALVSYQIMSTERTVTRVLAVAIPLDVLNEYESIATEAGLQPGAVLPSTLAALAALEPAEAHALVLNSAQGSLTSAIVRGGTLLLHRTMDLQPASADAPETEGMPLAPSFPQQAAAADPYTAEANTAVALLNFAPEAENASRDLAETVSVASAYFEDTLATPATTLLTAGITSAQAVRAVLQSHGLSGFDVRELFDSAALGPGVSTNQGGLLPGWLAGVRGALRT